MLWADLSSGGIKVEPISHYAGFIGGRGIAQRILFEKVSPEVGPLDAANHIIFATGPLNGTLAPSCSRLSVNTKNVLTGGTSSSSVGGHLAAELKYAGVDILVVFGKRLGPWDYNEHQRRRALERRSWMRACKDIGRSAFGVSTAGDPLSYEGKAELVVWHEKYKAVVDCLGMCYYTSFWTDVNLLGPDDYARLFSAATGVAMSGDEMMSIGRRIHNIEKAFNTLHAGFTRNDDLPPPRLMTEPVKAGPFRGEVLERPQWEELLDEYYSLHGWDRASGWQTRRCLEELGLSEAIEKLSKAGRLL